MLGRYHLRIDKIERESYDVLAASADAAIKKLREYVNVLPRDSSPEAMAMLDADITYRMTDDSEYATDPENVGCIDVQCGACDETFESDEELRDHYRAVHAKEQ
jgi:hypothetical protein